MPDFNKITRLLDEWEKLTVKEGEAIEQDLWDVVLGIQNSKKELQKILDAEITEPPKKLESYPGFLEIKKRVAEIIELEKQNKSRIDSKMQRAVGEYSSMKNKMDNLKKIRSVYGETTLPSWQVYT